MPLLFEPLQLREVRFPNRVWLSPMCQYSCDAQDGLPHDWHLAHLGSRAQGGFGLVMSEAVAVTAEGRITAQDAGLWSDEHTAAWARIVDFVHAMGSTFGFQIAHAGRKASTYRGFPGEASGAVLRQDGGWTTVAPSTIAHHGNPAPRALTRVEMDAVREAFVAAAQRADQASADVLEIHAAHGYLLHQFLSPLANDRDDEYGASFENRVRFPLEVVDAVRSAWPASKPLFVRVSATDWIPGGWDIDQTSRFAGLLKQRGVDLVDVSSGSIGPADIPVGLNYQVPLSARIRADNAMPTAAVGLILEPEQAEKILRSAEADAVFLARAALREPAWPLRAAWELGLKWNDAPYPGQYARGRWDAVPRS